MFNFIHNVQPVAFSSKSIKTLSCYFPSTGTLNDKVHIVNPAPNGSEAHEEDISPPNGINCLFKAVLSSPGPIVSFSRLNTKGVFRRHATHDITGKHLMQQVADQLPELELGTVEQFTVPGFISHWVTAGLNIDKLINYHDVISQPELPIWTTTWMNLETH